LPSGCRDSDGVNFGGVCRIAVSPMRVNLRNYLHLRSVFSGC
jgi:hypothetical protein